MYFSASDLIKKSAAQIKYLRDKKISIHTWRMQNGVEFQHQIAEKKENAAEEFRSSYNSPDNEIVIFATHDIVTPTEIIEVKTIQYGKEQWYFESSLLQAAYYKALLMQSSGDLYTPTFRVNEGYPKEHKKVDPNIPYKLQFGDETYSIDVLFPDVLIDYFLQKAKATLGSYDDCREYDSIHKFKHYEQLKHTFTYENIPSLH